MKYLLSYVTLFIFCSTQAQEVFHGMVVDSASFNPLPYVSVLVKHKGRGTNTDNHGNFNVVASRQDTIVFSLVGYERLELPLYDYEESMIRLAERNTLLQTITINDSRIDENPYDGMFDEQNAKLKQKIPFYYSRARKDKVKAGRWRDENVRVKTYVDLLINTPETKAELMKKYSLTDEEYYALLAQFNEKNYKVMYYLTSVELLSLINRFFENHAPLK
jgi:hypothetical protein